jgi:hypothetical protein
MVAVMHPQLLFPETVSIEVGEGWLSMSCIPSANPCAGKLGHAIGRGGAQSRRVVPYIADAAHANLPREDS